MKIINLNWPHYKHVNFICILTPGLSTTCLACVLAVGLVHEDQTVL